MRVAATSARIVGSIVGTLILVPGTVIWLVEIGVAGSWKWFPACLVVVAGVAGCTAAALWWPRRRMRFVAGFAALVWGSVALSAAYWPAVATRAEVRAAFDRVHYDGGLVDPTVTELGPAWCTSGLTSVMGCPWLSAGYLVDEGEGEDVIRALQEAGFQLVGEPQQRPVEDFDLPGSGSIGVGSRYWLKGEGMRLEVTVVSDQEMALPVAGIDSATMYVPSGTERVNVEMSDSENSQRLQIPDDLGFWTPDASLTDLQPPPGW